MNCPRCKSSSHKKNGRTGGRQRYKCHDCGYNFSVKLKSTASPESVKQQALQLYLEELGFRSISPYLGVSHISVYNWIKTFGQELEDLKSENNISIIDFEMLKYSVLLLMKCRNKKCFQMRISTEPKYDYIYILAVCFTSPRTIHRI